MMHFFATALAAATGVYVFSLVSKKVALPGLA